MALEGSWKEAQAAAERAEERANFSATELAKCHQIIEKLQVCPSKWPIIMHILVQQEYQSLTLPDSD